MLRILRFSLAILVVLALQAGAYATSFYSEGPRSRSKIAWKEKEISIAISDSFFGEIPNIKAGSDISGAIERSLASWERALGITFLPSYSSLEDVSPSGAAGDGISLITAAATNDNIRIFGPNTADIPAATRIFYDAEGNITEADIVLNPLFQFSTDGTFGTYDLESVLVHEIGHLLGLDHVPVPGSVMSGHLGRNGLYGVTHFSQRKLTAADRVLGRSLYGPLETDEECCAEIYGQIDLDKGGERGIIWLENADTGTLAAAIEPNAGGYFELKGLDSGLYSAYWSSAAFGAEHLWIDTLLLEVGDRLELAVSPGQASVDAAFEHIGLIGQLSVVSLPLNRGRTFTVYLGSRAQDVQGLSVFSTSPFIDVSETITHFRTGRDDLRVVMVDVTVADDAPEGSYSLLAKDVRGRRSFLPGVLTVTEFTNPWLKRETSSRP